ncbi:MAG: polymer-forming cytoskeletal protein [Hyphomicrobium sp.]
MASTHSHPSMKAAHQKFDGPDGAVFIGKGTQAVGEISHCTMVVIRGRIEGNIDTKVLIVESEGALVGNVHADHMEIHGRIEGNAVVSDLADIRSTGLITGELVYGQLSVAAGGQVHGTIRQASQERGAEERAISGNGVHETLSDTAQSVVQ